MLPLLQLPVPLLTSFLAFTPLGCGAVIETSEPGQGVIRRRQGEDFKYRPTPGAASQSLQPCMSAEIKENEEVEQITSLDINHLGV